MVRVVSLLWALLTAALLAVPAQVFAQAPSSVESGLLEFRFKPVGYSQIAIWVESEQGDHMATVRLTEAVSLRGIGNRPGASQMNGGFRWPYGRREGVLPIWASRRAASPGAKQFKRVIFQNRVTEGLASRTSNDQSVDDHFCLSFDSSKSKQDALDAVSCASQFFSDKGRFINEEDLQAGYAEPYEDLHTQQGRMSPLSRHSLYPPRRDVKHCGDGCNDHPDMHEYVAHARDVMPELDAITMATPQGGAMQRILFQIPPDWPAGNYTAWLEINKEGDYNSAHSEAAYPTPRTPQGTWDTWAMSFGYAYRGQPSVAFAVPFSLGADAVETFATADARGIGGWDREQGDYTQLLPLTSMTDDPVSAPGSGVDRLSLLDHGDRLQVVVRPPLDCMENSAPGPVRELGVLPFPEETHAHERATLRFRAAEDDNAIFRYEVRISLDPITDEHTFLRGTPAKTASTAEEQLMVPTGADAGEWVQVDLGGMNALGHYYIGMRAVDACAYTGDIAVAEYDTPQRVFTTVTPCFVATAAYGTPLSQEVGVLRRLRDRYLMSNSVGRALVGLYYEVGPHAADAIRDSELLRASVRGLLEPLVAMARRLDP